MCFFTLILGTGLRARAACPAQLSMTEVWMLPYDSITISVTNPKAKVKWSVSGSIGIKVKKSYGKYKQKITLTSGSRTGNATLTAKTGGTRLTCPVHVANAYRTGNAWHKKSKTVLKKVIKKGNSIIVRVRMCNGSSSPASFSSSFELERYTGGKWVVVPPRKGVIWTEVLSDFWGGWETLVDYRLSDHYDAKNLKKGTYRICCHIQYPGKAQNRYYVRFKL